jgi:hypothetical protein
VYFGINENSIFRPEELIEARSPCVCCKMRADHCNHCNHCNHCLLAAVGSVDAHHTWLAEHACTRVTSMKHTTPPHRYSRLAELGVSAMGASQFFGFDSDAANRNGWLGWEGQCAESAPQCYYPCLSALNWDDMTPNAR